MAQATAQTRTFRSSPHQEKKAEKKGSMFKSPGNMLVAGFGILFVSYVFNVHGLATTFDSYFASLNHAAQGHSGTVSNLFIKGLPLVAAGFVIFIVLVVLRAVGPSKTTLGHTKREETRGVEAFVAAAGEHGVSLKVARAAYRLLLPHVRKGKYLGVADTLCKDLKVKPDFVTELYGSLLRHSDRVRRQGDDGASIHTVMGLLLAVEASKERNGPKPVLLDFQSAGPVAVQAPPAGRVVAIPQSAPPVVVAEAAPKEKKKDAPAVVLHPARLARRELSMIRSRSRRSFQA
jgi:hypothetical protein